MWPKITYLFSSLTFRCPSNLSKSLFFAKSSSIASGGPGEIVEGVDVVEDLVPSWSTLLPKIGVKGHCGFSSPANKTAHLKPSLFKQTIQSPTCQLLRPSLLTPITARTVPAIYIVPLLLQPIDQVRGPWGACATLPRSSAQGPSASARFTGDLHRLSLQVLENVHSASLAQLQSEEANQTSVATACFEQQNYKCHYFWF